MVSILLWPGNVSAQSFSVKLDGDQLRVSAVRPAFFSNEVVKRLHNGIAVTFVLKIGTTPNLASKPAMQSVYRFVISYDIFEEKYAVSRIEPNPRSITHLSETAAQLWCLDSIGLSTVRIAADQPFWVQLDYQTEEAKPTATDSGGSIIGGLIDVFSRKNQHQDSRGTMAAGPFNLSELRKTR
jgi:hypothetical protein